MCLTVSKRFHNNSDCPRRIDTDTLVYKVLFYQGREETASYLFRVHHGLPVFQPEWNCEYCTPVIKYPVYFNERYEAKLVSEFGLHYDIVWPSAIIGNNFVYDHVQTVEQGIHSYYLESEANNFAKTAGERTRVYPAVIPAGTPFYIGEQGDVVSTELIIYQTPDAAALKKRNAVPLEEWI